MTATAHTGLTPAQLAINEADIALRRAGLPAYSALLVELRILSTTGSTAMLMSDGWKATIDAAWNAYVNTEGRQ